MCMTELSREPHGIDIADAVTHAVRMFSWRIEAEEDVEFQIVTESQDYCKVQQHAMAVLSQLNGETYRWYVAPPIRSITFLAITWVVPPRSGGLF